MRNVAKDMARYHGITLWWYINGKGYENADIPVAGVDDVNLIHIKGNDSLEHVCSDEYAASINWVHLFHVYW